MGGCTSSRGGGGGERATEPCPCPLCSGEPKGTSPPQRGGPTFWDPKHRQTEEARPQPQGRGRGCPEQRIPGQARSSYPSPSQHCAQSKDPGGSPQSTRGPAGTLLSSEACLAQVPVVRGVKGHGSPVHPRPVRPVLALGSRGQRHNPPLEGPMEKAREIPLAQPSALPAPGLGRPFFSVLRNPSPVPINDLSSSPLTGSLQLGWH